MMPHPGSHIGRYLKTPAYQAEGKGGGGQEDGGGSFTDPVFDDEYYGRDQAGGKGRTMALVAGVVAGAVIAGAAAWTVFGPNSDGTAGQIPLIVAEPEPYKVRPDDPGGMQVENQDKLVYERLDGASSEAGVESILPPPETPKAPVAEAEPVAPPAPVVAETAPPAIVPEPVTPAPAAPEPEQVAEVTPSEPAPAITTEPPAVPTPAAPSTTAPAPVEAASTPQPDEDSRSLESFVAALSGDYLIQIAALRSEDVAQSEWDRLSTRYASLLGSYRPMIVRADLGERGIFYRLRAGPLKDRPAADELCAALAAENVGCLVVRNE